MRRMGGSRAASAEIEAIYGRRFRAFLFSVTALLGDGEAAFDVVQDGFALALRRRDSYRREGSLEAWLWRIVLNVACDHRRSSRRLAALPHFDTTEDAREPDNDVRASLLALPERQRHAVFLRYYADLSYEQIAEALSGRPCRLLAESLVVRQPRSLSRVLQRRCLPVRRSYGYSVPQDVRRVRRDGESPHAVRRRGPSPCRVVTRRARASPPSPRFRAPRRRPRRCQGRTACLRSA